VVQGRDEGREYRLPAYPSVMGRGSGADLIIDDPRSSRTHACFALTDGDWTVRDLGSPNGTFVDGRRIDGSLRLRDGSRIRLGHTVLLFDAGATKRAGVRRAGVPTIPGYELLERVGAGTASVVYRARQLSLDRIVAVKILTARLAAHPDFVSRFVAEARAAAQLLHPHVVPVFDVGHDAGVHFFAMEFMTGGTVADLVRDAEFGRLRWSDAVAIAADAARGLAFAEEHGIVHRDVKPGNLLLDGGGCTKLGDLGTAVRASDAAGERIGTPHYMSPEQARREPVTHASDVYSLGATLYVMLSGRTPFNEAPVQEILRRVAHTQPISVAHASRSSPPELAALVDRMMHADPRARPTAAQVVQQFDRIGTGKSDPPKSSPRNTPRRPFRRRRSRSSLAVAGVLLLAISGAIYALRDQLELAYYELRGDPLMAVARPPRTPPARSEPNARAAHDAVFAAEQRLGELDSESADAWRRVADGYAALPTTFPPELEIVVRAHWKAKEIRDRLREVTEPEPRPRSTADSWVARALRNAGVTDGGRAGKPPRRPLARLSDLRDERDEVLARADAAIAENDVAAALQSVVDWIAPHHQAAAASQSPENYRADVNVARTWLERTSRREASRLDDAVKSDVELLRAHLPGSAVFGALGPWPGFDAADERLRALGALMLTPVGSERVSARRERLRLARAAWDSLPDVTEVKYLDRMTRQQVARRVVLSTPADIDTRHRVGMQWLLVELQALDFADPAQITAFPRPSARARTESYAISGATWAEDGSTPPIAWILDYGDTDAAILQEGVDIEMVSLLDLRKMMRFTQTWGGTPTGDR